MVKALYRKYRPKSLSEVVGQKHITDTLANAIAAGKISHAYLLTGPRGVGKTSIARILAYELNGIEYDEEKAQLDIIEIDAASNRRIDEIRNLRDKVHILPTSNKYKVYIIDEVHMLTREAFNALLKTLEEPPAHAIFILATTESHKLPETIVSRTQHFTFKPIEPNVITDHLQTIAKSEKLKIDTDALRLIADHGDGSFRDSISLLDQARGLSDNISREEVQHLLGIVPADALELLMKELANGDPKSLFNTLIDLRSQGFQSSLMAKQLGAKLREQIIEDTRYQTSETLKLLSDLLTVTGSSSPDRALEIALLDYIFTTQPRTQVPTLPEPQPKPVAVTTEKKAVEEKPKNESDVPKLSGTKTEVKAIEQEAAIESTAEGNFTLEAWPIVVAEVKKKYNTVYGILRMAQPRLEGNKLILVFKFAFHQKQINESKNRKVISDIIKQQTGQEITIVCEVGKVAAEAKSTNNNIVSNVSDIFGGAEVLES